MIDVLARDAGREVHIPFSGDIGRNDMRSSPIRNHR
jgi:hypothetical protein